MLQQSSQLWPLPTCPTYTPRFICNTHPRYQQLPHQQQHPSTPPFLQPSPVHVQYQPPPNSRRRPPPLQAASSAAAAAAVAVTAAAGNSGFQLGLPQLVPASGPWGVWAGLVVAGAFGMWSERTKIGKELSGALVATLAGTFFCSG
jgi:hypothetical protein